MKPTTKYLAIIQTFDPPAFTPVCPRRHVLHETLAGAIRAVEKRGRRIAGRGLVFEKLPGDPRDFNEQVPVWTIAL